MDTCTRRVIIVDGGSAGWIAAARIAARWRGVTETNFLRGCDAAFKQGAKFVRLTDGTDCVDFNRRYARPALLPKQSRRPKTNYAYHLDAVKFAGFSGGTALFRSRGPRESEVCRRVAASS